MTNFFLDSCNFVLGIFFTALALAFFAQRPCTAMIATNYGSANPAIILSFLMNAFYGGSANLATRLSFKMNATRPTHFRWPS